MKLFKRSVPVWTLVLVIIVCGSVVAEILISKQIQFSMRIKGVANMLITKEDYLTELTAIDFGDLFRGDLKRFPATGDYGIKNTGEYPLYMSYTLTNFPTGVTLRMFIKQRFESTFTQLSEGTIYPTKCEVAELMKWYIEIQIEPDAAFGTYNPTLTWSGHSSSTG